MIRSSYIDWLLSQTHRGDGIGDAARWLSKHILAGFEPVDMFCLLEKAESEDDLHLTESIKEGLVEFGMTVTSYYSITDEQTTRAKLEAALREEDYLKAAKLRDELNGNK